MYPGRLFILVVYANIHLMVQVWGAGFTPAQILRHTGKATAARLLSFIILVFYLIMAAFGSGGDMNAADADDEN